jgi:hypothetical protein
MAIAYKYGGQAGSASIMIEGIRRRQTGYLPFTSEIRYLLRYLIR